MRRDDDAELREKGVCGVNGIGRLTTSMGTYPELLASLIIRIIILATLGPRMDLLNWQFSLKQIPGCPYFKTGLEARGDISEVFWACSGKLRCWACMVAVNACD